MSFLVAAYVVLWAGVFGYLLWLGARVRRLLEEVRLLESGGHEVAESRAAGSHVAGASTSFERTSRD